MLQIIIIKLLSNIIVFYQLVSSFYTFLRITILPIVAEMRKNSQSLHCLHYVFRFLLIPWSNLNGKDRVRNKQEILEQYKGSFDT